MLAAMDLSLLVMLVLLTSRAADRGIASKPMQWARAKVRATASRCGLHQR